MHKSSSLLRICFGFVLLLQASSGSSADSLFWLDLAEWNQPGEIRYADVTTGGTATVSRTAATLNFGLAIEPASRRVFWTTAATSGPGSGVFRSNIDGTQPVRLWSSGGGQSLMGIAVDPIRNRIVWSQVNRIWLSDLDGHGATQVSAPRGATILGVLIDSRDGQVYLGGYQDEIGRIWRMNQNGTAISLFRDLIPGRVQGMLIDEDSDQLYYTGFDFGPDTGGIWRTDLNGPGTTEVLSGFDVGSIALDESAADLYWTASPDNGSTAYIGVLHMDDGSIETHLFDTDRPSVIGIGPTPSRPIGEATPARSLRAHGR